MPRYRLHLIDGVDLLLKLFAKLAGHVPRAAYPAAHLLYQARQLLGSEHHERHTESEDHFRETEVKEAALPGPRGGRSHHHQAPGLLFSRDLAARLSGNSASGGC